MPQGREASCASVAAVAASVAMTGGRRSAVTNMRTEAQAKIVTDQQHGCEVKSSKHTCRRGYATGKCTRLRCFRWPQLAWSSTHSTRGSEDLERSVSGDCSQPTLWWTQRRRHRWWSGDQPADDTPISASASCSSPSEATSVRRPSSADAHRALQSAAEARVSIAKPSPNRSRDL